MTTGNKIREMRNARGLTQEELADRLYITRSAVAKWENDIGYPDIVSLKNLSREFGITIDSLLTEDDIVSITKQRKKANILMKVLIGLMVALFATGIFFSIFTFILMNTMEPDYLKTYFGISLGVTVFVFIVFILLMVVAIEDHRALLLDTTAFVLGAFGIPLLFIGLVSLIQRRGGGIDAATIVVFILGLVFTAGSTVSFIFSRKHAKSLLQ